MPYSLPRQLEGATPSARVHNTAAAELDALAWSLTVRAVRTVKQVTQYYPGYNIDYTIPWEKVSGGTNRGNWSPGLSPVVKITQSGTYLMLLQVRFEAPLVAATGRYQARVMLNGTSPMTDTIGQNSEPEYARGTLGHTVQALSVRPLQAGDTLWCGWSRYVSGNPYVTDAHLDDYGGTYFTVIRIGPGAGALTADEAGGSGGVPRLESGTRPPVDTLNFVAQAIDNLGVCARPRRSTSFTVALNSYQVISWEADGIDTRGDMWDPAEPQKLTIRVAGTYFFELRVWWPSTGAQAGDRMALLWRNTIEKPSVISAVFKASSAAYEGAFCVARAVVRCSAGDVIYAGAVANGSAGTVGALSFGGTYLFAARVGRSGDGGSVLEGESYDTDPIVDTGLGELGAGRARAALPVGSRAADGGVGDGPMGGPVRDRGITA